MPSEVPSAQYAAPTFPARSDWRGRDDAELAGHHFVSGKSRTAPCRHDERSHTFLTPGKYQNSSRAWSAIMRGELSPPKPTPSSPVGGEVV
jgi:hypothetical protein